MTHRRRRVFEASRSHARRRSVHPKAYSFRAAQACAMVSRRSLSAARPKRIALGTHAVQHRHAQRGYEGAVASAAARARYRPARRSAVVHCPRRAKNFSRGIEGELETKGKGGLDDVFPPRVCLRVNRRSLSAACEEFPVRYRGRAGGEGEGWPRRRIPAACVSAHAA